MRVSLQLFETCWGPTLIHDKQHTRTDVIAIGASTGGPRALIELLDCLPSDFPIPIIVAQHIETGFLNGFVEWLDTLLGPKVVHAKAGTKLAQGTVYVLQTEGQLHIDHERVLHYRPTPDGQLYVPSIDLLFSCLIQARLRGLAFLLSGMGRDGAIGLKQLADTGWSTFVQAPESCIVAGMPTAALNLSTRHRTGTPIELSRVIKREELFVQRSVNDRQR